MRRQFGSARTARADTLAAAVDVEAAVADEAEECHAAVTGQAYGQAGRRPHRGEHGDAGERRLLHQLEARPAADEEHAAGERQFARDKEGADELVECVVPADVLAHGQKLATGVEQRGGMEAARSAERVLSIAERGGELSDHLGADDRSRRDAVTLRHLDRGDRTLAADATARMGVAVAREARPVRIDVVPECDADDVPPRPADVANVVEIARRADDAFGVKESACEVEILPGGPHGNRRGAAHEFSVPGHAHPNFQRLLDHQRIEALAGRLTLHATQLRVGNCGVGRVVWGPGHEAPPGGRRRNPRRRLRIYVGQCECNFRAVNRLA